MKLQLLLYVNMSVAVEDGIEFLIWGGYGVELFFYLLTLFCVPNTHLFLKKHPLYHPNMLLIFFVAMYSIYIFTIARIGVAYYEVQSTLPCEIYAETTETCAIPLIVFSTLRCYVFCLVPSLLGLVLIERIVATVKVAIYEVRYHRCVFWFLIIYLALSSVSTAILYTLDGFSRSSSVFLAICSIAFYGLMIQVVIRINERKEHQMQKAKKSYSLSKRYQLTENIRSSKVFSWLVWYSVINNSIYGALYLIHGTDISWTIRNWIGIFLYVYMSFYWFTMSIFGALVDRRLFNLYKSFWMEKFKRNRRKTRPTSGEPSNRRRSSEPILDVKGNVLYTGAKQDDYFVQLELQWGSMRSLR